MAVVLLTTVSYNCAPVMAQPEQPFAQEDIPDGNQSVTPEEMEQCMDAWDSSTQMSHREWAQSCRRTLRESWQQDINPIEEYTPPKKRGPGKPE
jgi:hypothetical protein